MPETTPEAKVEAKVEPMTETITLTIDGKTCVGEKGQTVLQIARANGIDIPTLCDHPWLPPRGACRLCVVEVEGQRRLVTSCAAPATDGMAITAHNDRLAEMRQMTLELLFAERNHICPFCPMSGICELQNEAYDHGITHTRYDYLFPTLKPDTSNEYFVHDPNRCILCARCVRACDLIAGTGTLDLGYRGTQQVVIADFGVPLGESSCIRCGACIDVCPTGAMFEKRAPFLSRQPGLYAQFSIEHLGQANGHGGGEGSSQELGKAGTQLDHAVTPLTTRQPDLDQMMVVCPDDDLGASMRVATKSGLIALVEGTEEAPVNGPLLSWRSRFELLNEPYKRVRKPRVRNDRGQLEETDWDTALNRAVELLRGGIELAATGEPGIGALISGRLPRELLSQVQAFLEGGLGCSNYDTFNGRERIAKRAALEAFGRHTECDLNALHEADLVLLVGFDPLTTHPVVGGWLAGKRHHQQVPIVSINARPAKSAAQAHVALRPKRGAEQTVVLGLLAQLLDLGTINRRVDPTTANQWRAHPVERVAAEADVDEQALKRAARLYAEAERPIILYGPDIGAYGNPNVIRLLWEMARTSGHTTEAGALRVLGFNSEANAAAAEALGYRGVDLEGVQVVYVLQGDDLTDLSPLQLEGLDNAPAVILQTAVEGPLMKYATVVLPSLKWSERRGTWVNVTGFEQTFEAPTEPPQGVRTDEAVLTVLRRQVVEAMEAEGQEVSS